MFGIRNTHKYIPKIADKKHAYRRDTHAITFETVKDKNMATFIVYANQGQEYILMIYDKENERCNVKYNIFYRSDYGLLRVGNMGDKLNLTWDIPSGISLGTWKVEMTTVLKDGQQMVTNDNFELWIEDPKENSKAIEERDKKLKESRVVTP